MRFLFLAVSGLLLSGCAGSYVSGVERSEDSLSVAASIAEIIAAKVPANPGTISLSAPQADNPVTTGIENNLRMRNYTLGDGGHEVRYLVTPLENGVALRVTIDGTIYTRHLSSKKGRVEADAPSFVQEPT